MKNKLTYHLGKYVVISEELEEILTSLDIIKEYPKGTVLLKEGDICNECYFIVKGLIRSFYLDASHEEITTDFFMEDNIVSPSCYGTNNPSKNNYICQEDTITYVGTPQIEKDMYSKYPQLADMSRIIGERVMAGYQDSFDQFRMASPEQRYKNLLQTKPGLIQRVPQYQLASYLGMTPESLSRIRKRIS